MKYVISYDLGTTGNKASLFRIDGNLISSSFCGYKTFYPSPNMVEQDPNEWWESIKKTTCEMLKKSKVNKEDIISVSFSGQMMGTVPVDKSGKPLRKAIIWADQRSIKELSKVNQLGNEYVYKLTGSRITPTYSGPKIAWIKNNEPEVYKNTYKFLNTKDYIGYKFTGKYGTDYSDASMTLLFDIKEKKWSEELIEKFDIDIKKLPELSSSTEVIGEINPKVAEDIGLSKKTIVVRGAGDGACAALGAGITNSETGYVYLGSSSWVSTYSEEPFFDEEMRTFNFVSAIGKYYCPTGTMQAGGASYQWIKDSLCKYEEKVSKSLGLNVFSLLDDILDNTEPGSKKLIFLPYLLGERSPWWNINARGAFIGLSSIHSKAEMIRSVLEGVSYNLKIILDILENKKEFHNLRLIGGGAKGRNWKQIIADIFGKTIEIPEHVEEATSIGAAIIAAVGAGEIEFELASKFVKSNQIVFPNESNHEKYKKFYNVFVEAYEALVGTYNSLASI